MLAALPVVVGEGTAPQALDLLNGAAWLYSEVEGRLVRVDGATGKVDAEVSVGANVGASLEQDGDTVLVAVDGTIRSLDLAQLDWGGSITGGGQLVVGDGVAYVVEDEGEVREVDPATLRTRHTTALGGRPGRGVIVEGRLALPLDDGTVRIVDGGEQTGTARVGGPGDLVHVAKVGRRLVALNASQGTVREIDARRARFRSDFDVALPEGELLVPSELPPGPLWLVAARSGELVRVDLREGAVAQSQVVPPRADVAGPAAADGRVYLVDRGQREIVEVDGTTLEVTQRKALEIDDASRVEVVTEGGYIFVNDLAGSKAVVIDDGTYRTVDKGRTGDLPGSSPDEPDASDDGTSDQGRPDRPADGSPADQGPAPGPPPVPATDPPGAPAAVTAVAGNASATVAWQHGAGTTPPTGYQVTYEGARSPVPVAGATASVEIDGLRNGQTYRFTVWATNAYGESTRVRSNEVEPNDEVPGSPSGVTATAGDAEADVSWEEADGRGNDVTGYVVTAEPGGQTATVDGDVTTASVTGLANDTSYTFTVAAINELDTQGEPSAPSPPVVPYGPPTGLTGLTHNSGDQGTLDLGWNASTSRQAPVTYVVTLAPAVGGQSEWSTSALSWSRSGLAVGTTYTVTVTPTNDRGAGGQQSDRVTPGRDATVDTPTASRTADRTFRVSFTYDDGGRSLSACTVTRNGGSAVNANCSGGTGSASVTVPNYYTNYTFTATVDNALGGDAAASAGARSAAKPFTIRSDAAAFDGTCTWDDEWSSGRPNTRPYFTNPRDTCPEGTPAADRPIGYLAIGTTVRGECHIQGKSIRDDDLVATTTWIRVSGRGYMPTIYFTNFQSSPTANLPAC